MALKHFQLSEFDSPDIEGSGKDMCPDFLEMIDRARDIAGIPFKINSGMRSKAWNEHIGGRIGSSHLKGCAADVHCNNSGNRSKIVSALIQAGFRRIGIANTFIHADCDNDKPNAIWLY
jgi:zinc D-Ala-D-Ala carboxypeptidase